MNVPFNYAEKQMKREMRSVNSFDVRSVGRRPTGRGRTAIEQARLIMLVMLNIAQLWILAAAVEAALAHSYKKLLPLVIASGVCWFLALSIILWWRPASCRYTSTGYVRENRR